MGIQSLEPRRFLSNQPSGPALSFPRGGDSGVEVVASGNNFVRVHAETINDVKTKILQWFNASGQPLSEPIVGRTSPVNFSAKTFWVSTDDQAAEAWQESDERTVVRRFNHTGVVGSDLLIQPNLGTNTAFLRDVAMHEDGRLFFLSRRSTGLELAIATGNVIQRMDIHATGELIDDAYLTLAGDRLGVVWRDNATRVQSYDVRAANPLPIEIFGTHVLTADRTLFLRDVDVGDDGTLAVALWNPDTRRPMIQTVNADASVISAPLLVSQRGMDNYAVVRLQVDEAGRIAYAFSLGSGESGDTFLRWYSAQADPITSEFVVHDRYLAGAQYPAFVRGEFEHYDVGYMTAYNGPFLLQSFDQLGQAAGPSMVVENVDYDNGSSSAQFSHRAAIALNGVSWNSLEVTDFELTGTSPSGTVLQPRRYLPTELPYDRASLLMAGPTGSSLPPLLDGFYRLRVKAADVGDRWGNPLAASIDYPFTVMKGDANADATVDFSDLLILAQNYGSSNRASSQGNVNFSADGKVNFDDLLLLAQRFGASLSVVASASNSRHPRASAIDVLT